jgi:GT2 family glycosyltransferase
VELTLNLPEKLNFNLSDFSYPISVHVNQVPHGFAANHNKAFLTCTEPFYCVMNPDIRINEDPFHALLGCLQDPTIGVAAPMVVGENGQKEDSARLFPTPFKILCKVFGRGKGSDYEIKNESIYPDWVGGMFMLFPREIFEKLHGFNEHFFLYYEDVELCARLRLLGYKVVMSPAAKVTHYARRSSHTSFRYFKWHITSMLRFFCSKVFLQVIWSKFWREKIN